MTIELFRDLVLGRLVSDLAGPAQVDEVLSDRPTQRYSTAILYPQNTAMRPEEDEDGARPANYTEDTVSEPDEEVVALHATLKPSSAGFSFAVEAIEGGAPVGLTAEVACGLYERFGVDDHGSRVDGEPRDRRHERWQRRQHRSRITFKLDRREILIDLADHGLDGLTLYSLAAEHEGVLNVTVALVNQRGRGDSSAFDEAQHFFQVELEVTIAGNGRFAPRPSRHALTDDDSRTGALIYRGVAEYVVGHTCSARAVLTDGEVLALRAEWIPMTVVPRVSDQGDEVFDVLRNPASDRRPLDARWLAQASPSELVGALEQLVLCYDSWIDRESARVPSLPDSLQAQAEHHIDRCRDGARRMRDGIAAIATDDAVRTAFQLAQSAMELQFAWSRDGAALTWRPFQLAFQLLALRSVEDRAHADREVMDLLWFPTGGGKTEAYLALTAFVVLLRRLRATKEVDGSGVAVLMRYTLRLLTIQQFQRAAAVIFACELLRQERQGTGLGKAPIGIGLWVGAAATPLTLADAFTASPSDPSTPRQITTCPCCGAQLKWTITRRESTVECGAPDCRLARSVPRLPVWTIDEEVYSHRPSLLIGTVDKFAQIVRKPETATLFGRAGGDDPPDLIIQDELHLISGPLGSMVGLYEVAVDELCRRGTVRPKIIGSTATIRRAEDQIRALFDRGTYQFPAPGLDASNSGFAVADPTSPGRLYVGVTTAGRSATYMLQALVASLLQSATAPGVSDEERDKYWTLVTYFNSLRELGRALVLMQDDVPVSIRQFAGRHGEQERRIEAPAELTSRVRSYEIRDMLERLGKPAYDPEAVDLLAASNMISVGMDIPRLGLMVVNAQPKTLSEYIQATSRVGRGDVPGMVVTMYNSLRVRDRSRFETFDTWHRSLYRDVEATSVTPFAPRAQDKALHAVLVALVRHLVPGLGARPVLDDLRRAEAESIAAVIEARAARVDTAELDSVARKLASLIDEWASRPDLQVYWDDYNRRTSLLMSAEQFAARADADPDLDTEGRRRVLWAAPNSMREVEPGAPFLLRNVLRTETA